MMNGPLNKGAAIRQLKRDVRGVFKTERFGERLIKLRRGDIVAVVHTSGLRLSVMTIKIFVF